MKVTAAIVISRKQMDSVDRKYPNTQILYITGKRNKIGGTYAPCIHLSINCKRQAATSKSSLNLLFMPALSAVPWTDCVTGYWHISVFMFVSWCVCAHVSVCALHWTHHSSVHHVWEGEQSCFKTICSSEYFSGGLSLWWTNARHRQTAKRKL